METSADCLKRWQSDITVLLLTDSMSLIQKMTHTALGFLLYFSLFASSSLNLWRGYVLPSCCSPVCLLFFLLFVLFVLVCSFVMSQYRAQFSSFFSWLLQHAHTCRTIITCGDSTTNMFRFSPWTQNSTGVGFSYFNSGQSEHRPRHLSAFLTLTVGSQNTDHDTCQLFLL